MNIFGWLGMETIWTPTPSNEDELPKPNLQLILRMNNFMDVVGSMGT